jgi:hypothetical protein
MILKKSGIVMYHAKAAGRSTYCFDISEMNDQIVGLALAWGGVQLSEITMGQPQAFTPYV